MKIDNLFGSSLTEQRYLVFPIKELRSYQISNRMVEEPIASWDVTLMSLLSRAEGWIGGENRQVETWLSSSGILLRVEGGNDFFIPMDGQSVISNGTDLQLTSLDREILLGPALVLAFAMQKTWCLHGSAAVFDEQAVVFLGESGQGKSTLAHYLSGSNGYGWRLLADDMLPVTLEPSGLTAWPHFPQLKLPLDAQPGPNWSEQVSISKVCVLVSAKKDDEPNLQLLSSMEAAQTLIRHTAGARLFDEKILETHLAFCASAVNHVSVYQLTYPHSRDALPKVRELLENLC